MVDEGKIRLQGLNIYLAHNGKKVPMTYNGVSIKEKVEEKLRSQNVWDVEEPWQQYAMLNDIHKV